MPQSLHLHEYIKRLYRDYDLTTDPLWRKKDSAMLGLTNVVNKPQPQVRNSIVVLPQDYLDLCHCLGFNPAANIDQLFLQFCFDQEISLYDRTHVWKYLKGARAASMDYIVWSPLRQADGPNSYRFSLSGEIEDHVRNATSYQQQVPMRVLKLVEQISRSQPEAKFFVSEIVRVTDPFAGVKLPGSPTMHIFAVWDEPGFSG